MISEREKQVRIGIQAASDSLLQTLSTSLGPKGLDKMLIKNNKTTVTNDGATILKHLKTHPVHSIYANVSSTQDEECGDGTTSVVILIGCLLGSATSLLDKVHPSTICDALEFAKTVALDYIESVKIPIKEGDLYSSVLTALSSKIAASSSTMAKASIRAMGLGSNDIKNIRIIKRLGGIIDDVTVHKSILLVHPNNIVSPNRARMALLQFCISAPKTNLDSKILINDHTLMEAVIREERKYILNLCKRIKASGCTLILVQKSVLREGLSDLAMHLLKQLGIMYVNSVEREEMDYISRSTGAKLISDIEMLDSNFLVDVDVGLNDDMVEIKNYGCSIVVHGCDELVLEEATRCLNDALCVVKCLNIEPFLVPGGGSVEIGISNALRRVCDTTAMCSSSTDSFCKSSMTKISMSSTSLDKSLSMLSIGPNVNTYVLREIAAAFEGIPYFLARNAGLYPVEVISDLKDALKDNINMGISVRSGSVSDMVVDDRVLQPAKVSISEVMLAIETVCMLLKVDDILPSRY